MIKNKKGFSFIEILFTLSLFSFLAYSGFYISASLLKKYRDKTVAHEILILSNAARILSTANQQPISLCLSDSANQCHKNKGSYLLTLSKEGILSEKQFKQPLIWHGFPNHSPITFYPDGRTNGNGHFEVGDYKVVIAPGGRSKITYTFIGSKNKG